MMWQSVKMVPYVLKNERSSVNVAARGRVRRAVLSATDIWINVFCD